MSLYNATKSHERGRKLSRHCCVAERMVLRKVNKFKTADKGNINSQTVPDMNSLWRSLGYPSFQQQTRRSQDTHWIYPTSETSRYSVVHASRCMTWLVSHVRTWDDTKRAGTTCTENILPKSGQMKDTAGGDPGNESVILDGS